jgi:hypothetical protein
MQPTRAAYCIANNPRTVQRSAAHRSAHRIPCIARITSHPVQRSAKNFVFSASQTIRAPKTSPHGAHLAPAALHALRSTLRWFRLVRGTNFSKIQFMGVCLLDR